jgi:hypothetical protein
VTAPSVIPNLNESLPRALGAESSNASPVTASRNPRWRRRVAATRGSFIGAHAACRKGGCRTARKGPERELTLAGEVHRLTENALGLPGHEIRWNSRPRRSPGRTEPFAENPAQAPTPPATARAAAKSSAASARRVMGSRSQGYHSPPGAIGEIRALCEAHRANIASEGAGMSRDWPSSARSVVARRLLTKSP